MMTAPTIFRIVILRRSLLNTMAESKKTSQFLVVDHDPEVLDRAREILNRDRQVFLGLDLSTIVRVWYSEQDVPRRCAGPCLRTGEVQSCVFPDEFGPTTRMSPEQSSSPSPGSATRANGLKSESLSIQVLNPTAYGRR